MQIELEILQQSSCCKFPIYRIYSVKWGYFTNDYLMRTIIINGRQSMLTFTDNSASFLLISKTQESWDISLSTAHSTNISDSQLQLQPPPPPVLTLHNLMPLSWAKSLLKYSMCLLSFVSQLTASVPQHRHLQA